MLEPDAMISVALPAVAWNQCLAVLAKGPWEVVDPLMREIRMQCMRAENAPGQQRPADHVHPADQDR